MESSAVPKITDKLLRLYSEAALLNADELLAEAALLLDHRHNARAYFLAVACIEEAGKALLAFDAQKRNLSDPAVCTKLKASMENHAQKITYALGIMALGNKEPHKALQKALDLIFDLRNGREPSMYTDLRANPDRVQSPTGIIRVNAAIDCIRLADHCLTYARRHVKEKTPLATTVAQDRLFTMKPRRFQEMLNNEDFWWYYITRMESGQQDMAEAVLGYERDHLKTGTPFNAAK